MRTTWKNLLGALLLSLFASEVTTAFAPQSVSSTISAASRHSNTRGLDTKIFQWREPIQEEEDRYLQLAVEGEGVMAKPEIVYVIMYNPGTDQEGVHTMEYPRGSETDLLLAFEFIGDCVNFANMLKEDPNWPQEPVPTPTPLAQMEIACSEMGLPIKVVPCTVQG